MIIKSRVLFAFLLLLMCAAPLVAQPNFITHHALIEKYLECRELRKTNLSGAIARSKELYLSSLDAEFDSLSIEISRFIGGSYYRKGEYDSAIIFTQESAQLAEENKEIEQLSKAYNNLSTFYGQLGNFIDAVDYLQLSLRLKEKVGEPGSLAAGYHNLGRLYFTQKTSTLILEARRYFKRSIELKKANGLFNNVPVSYSALAATYLETKDYDSATMLLEPVVFRKEELIPIDHSIYTNFAQALNGLKDHARAVAFLSKAELMAIDAELNTALPDIYLNFALVYMDLGNPTLALSYARKSYDLSTNMDMPESQYLGALAMAKSFGALEQFDSAYHYQTLGIWQQDSVESRNTESAFLGLEISRQAADNAQRIREKNQELERNELRMYVLGIVLALVIFLVLAVFNRYNLKRKATQELEQSNEEILKQKEEIHSQRNDLIHKNQQLRDAQETIGKQNDKLTNYNAQLEKMVLARTSDLNQANENLQIAIQDLDRFIYKTSHDIRGPLARLMGLCNLALVDVKDEKSLDYFKMLDISARSLNAVLLRLITINEINNSQLQPEQIDFERIRQEVDQTMQRLEAAEGVGLSWNLPTISFTSDANLILLIISNLVENGIRFRTTSERKMSYVNVDISANNKMLVIQVSDNGIGIQGEERQKLALMFSKSVEKYEITGLGLYLVKLSVEKLHGKLQLLPSDEGTRVQVEIPLQMHMARVGL